MDSKEKPFSLRRFIGERPIREPLSQYEKDLNFAMQSNGYLLDSENTDFKFDKDALKPLMEDFQGQRVSFFGPGGGGGNFFSTNEPSKYRLFLALSQPEVTSVIRKFRQVDEDQAARIAFLFGGIFRHLEAKSTEEIGKKVNFVARMTLVGSPRSADAIASAMSMYVISGGSLEEDKNFAGHVYKMAEAIEDDPIYPRETEDLGLSQVARLKSFLDKIPGKKPQGMPETGEYEELLDGFPTVGAEFHFPLGAANQHPNFWQRLAILNMSQYQRGSYVKLSRNDRDVIEVRMNPSIYPITIANWNHIRLLLPELNRTFFHTTINRKSGNFSWDNSKDRSLLNSLRALGLLSYATVFESIPCQEVSEEINFGSIYLGQTVRLNDGKYVFSGNWGRKEGEYGQMSIYAGFGNNLSYLVYYPSMALVNPQILEPSPYDLLSKVRTLKDAFSVSPKDRIEVFQGIQSRIEGDERLRKASEAGRQIIELLNP